MSQNPELVTTLDDAVGEVLTLLYGLSLTYDPRQDRYVSITRCLNRALRYNATEHEWSWYHSVESIGTASLGDTEFWISSQLRPRIINDDAVRFVDEGGVPRYWAYFLPRDALHKYPDRQGLWCSVVRNTLYLSRPIYNEDGLDIQVPVMREPVMFRLPKQPEDPGADLVDVPQEIRDQPIDFAYPDLIIARAAYMYASTDPVIQPRVQTLEQQYKNLMYQLIERDDSNTDTPYENPFVLPVQAGLYPDSPYSPHPLSDERR